MEKNYAEKASEKVKRIVIPNGFGNDRPWGLCVVGRLRSGKFLYKWWGAWEVGL